MPVYYTGLLQPWDFNDTSIEFGYDWWQPPGMRTDLWYSRMMAGAVPSAKSKADAMGAWQQGLAAAVRAARNAEEPQNAWFNLAVFYGQQNDHAHTEEALRAAISTAPNWFKPHWALARLLHLEGRVQEARGEAALAIELDAGHHAEVYQTLAPILQNTGNFKK